MGFIFIIIAYIIVFLISAIPLYLAIGFLGGKTTIMKTAVISFLAGIVISAVKLTFQNWGALIGFIILLFIYHEAFRLKWWKAFAAWVLQFVIIYAFLVIAAVLGLALL